MNRQLGPRSSVGSIAFPLGRVSGLRLRDHVPTTFAHEVERQRRTQLIVSVVDRRLPGESIRQAIVRLHGVDPWLTPSLEDGRRSRQRRLTVEDLGDTVTTDELAQVLGDDAFMIRKRLRKRRVKPIMEGGRLGGTRRNVYSTAEVLRALRIKTSRQRGSPAPDLSASVP